ncbi:hypothetical protein GCM10022233_20300 [Streptomyces shaanxiensis]|uniref:Secreted protein n=1 Tax=Streptomyces shaanxiensis TaxID=653357 RepID=A0ABP7USK7_9ACTN
MRLRLMRTLLFAGSLVRGRSASFRISNTDRDFGRNVESNHLRVNGPRSHNSNHGTRVPAALSTPFIHSARGASLPILK